MGLRDGEWSDVIGQRRAIEMPIGTANEGELDEPVNRIWWGRG